MLPELLQLQQMIEQAPAQLRTQVLTKVPHMTEKLPVYALALGKQDKTLPAVVLVGGVHGLERIGTQVVLAYLQTLLNRLPWDLCLQHTLEHCCIYFIPLLNPAGMANGWRANGNSVDLMRNAPVDCTEGAAWLVGGQRISRAIKSRIALRKIYISLFEQDYHTAITECDNAVATKPEFATAALRIKGELLLKLKHYADAELFYQQLLQRQKNLAWARLGHAVACFYQQRWDDTELQLADLTQFDETKVEALDWLSRLYVKYRRFEIAHDTLYEAALLSPKNITRLKTLANLASIVGDKPASARINGKIVATARHSVNDIAENYLNQARSLVDAAYCGNVLERAVTINNAAKIVDHLAKRFDANKLKAEITILRSRFLAAKGELADAKQLIGEIPLSYQQNITIDSCMDAAKAYFELGDLYASQVYIDKLQHILDRDDFLTETQRIMLEMEQKRHEALKAKLKIINAEATDAYQQNDFNTAFDRFAETFDHMPTNPTIAINLMQTMLKGARVNEQSQRYVRAAVKLLARSELDEELTVRFKRYLGQLKEMHPDVIPRRRPKEREVL